MTSTKTKGQGACDTCPVETHPLKTHITILSPADLHSKRVSVLRAAFAKRGHTFQVIRAHDGGARSYLAARWGHARSFDNLNAVEAFLRQIGGDV